MQITSRNETDKAKRERGGYPAADVLASPERREVLRWIGAGAAGAALLATLPACSPGSTSARGRAAWERVEPASALLDGAEPQRDAISLDLPAVSQDGSSIPLTVSIDSPMSEGDHIEAVYLYAAENPSPELAEIRFTPLAGAARIDTRIRLDQSQTVLALARTSRGEWLSGQRDVRVTVSGCHSRADTYDTDEVMHTRLRAPERLASGELGNVRSLINHPMETGLREDEAGETIPQWIIERFEAKLDGEPVVTARLYRSISANPYLRFPIAPRDSGELELRWQDDTGREATERACIRVG